MSLNSFSFIIYFGVLVIVMAIVQLKRKKAAITKALQLAFLLAFSYFFILKSDLRFCVCVAAVTVLTFLFGRWIERKHKKPILVIGVVLLVSFLAFFKYTNFFVNSFRSIAGLDAITLNIILPLGISF